MKVITMDNVKKSYKRYLKQESKWNNFFNRKYEMKNAVADFDLEVEEGEILGLLGQNGAGKTTIMKLLSGIIFPDSGEINVLEYTPFDKKKEFKKKIALLLGQKQQLWWDIPAIDNFEMFRDIYEIDKFEFKKSLNEMAEMLSVQDILTSPIRTLSLGERMKCELIAALLHKPKVLFLDEPTIGLDVVAQRNVRDFIKQYSKQNNATVIVTSHYMEDIKELCSKTVFIDKGKKYYDGTLDLFIKKHGEYCILNIELEDEINKIKIEHYGEVIMQEGNLIKLKISKQDYNNTRKEVMNIENIKTVYREELDASEILRNYFLKED